jgi:CheY-like chemotaxis protein
MKRIFVWAFTAAVGNRCGSRCALFAILPALLVATTVNGVEQAAPATPSNATNNVKAAVSDATAGDIEVAALGSLLTNQMIQVAKKEAAVESVFQRHGVVLTTFSALLVLMLLIVRFGRRLLARVFDSNAGYGGATSKAAAHLEPAREAEEKAFAAFASSFRIGPNGAARIAARPLEAPKTGDNKSADKEVDSKPTVPGLPQRAPAEVLTWAPTRIGRCRFLLQEISRMKGHEGQKKLISELIGEVQALKTDSAHPDLTPVWQVISSMEGLIKQLNEKPANITPSTLRTIAGCTDLLDRLCAAGVQPDLLKTPALRFLAVDDDPISRHTISFALKRALNAPDVAPNGVAGLALAEEHAYDAIFLDIQMPGMDGFELCKKIRAGRLHQTTPIVFVTCQSDFGSRAQSSLAGGCDLIGKPFLTFEITAKALILALGNRLNRLKEAQAQPQAA